MTGDKDQKHSALRVMPGVEGGHDGMPGARRGTHRRSPVRRTLSTEEYVQGVLSGDRTRLGRAITLIESNAPAHFDQAQEVLRLLLPHSGRSVRIGITGVPGVGKSTFIEAFGLVPDRARAQGGGAGGGPVLHRTGGSILGDKTRMARLCGRPGAFIRPSPTGGTLGGVARHDPRDACCCARRRGTTWCWSRRSGSGQSETAVRRMVDFFLVLMLAGRRRRAAGDQEGRASSWRT